MATLKGKIAVFNGIGRPFELIEHVVTPPAAGQALLKLAYSGICGTDVHIQNGFLPMPNIPLVLGHEFSGTIELINSEMKK